MGNTCVKKLPNITFTCINSGEMSSCCVNTKQPNDSLDCDERPGGVYFSYVWRHYPLNSTDPLEMSAVSLLFTDFDACKVDALNDISKRGYRCHVRLIIYECRDHCIKGRYYPVYETTVDAPEGTEMDKDHFSARNMAFIM